MRTRADAELAIDAARIAVATDALETMVRRMLGLTQRVEDFERPIGHIRNSDRSSPAIRACAWRLRPRPSKP